MKCIGITLLISLLRHTTTEAAPAGIQGHFEHLIGVANRLHVETQHATASTAVIRAALLLCANCSAAKTKGQFSEGIFVFDSFADRNYLSDSIFPALSQYNPKQLLWVGVQAYTLRSIYQLEEMGAEVTTIEPDAAQAVYGSHRQHIVAPLQLLLSHVDPETFDTVIINGVIGWGIDGEQAVQEAVKVVFRGLKAGGILVVGWNRGMGTCCDFDPWFISRGLAGLPATFDVPASETRHVFETFRKNDRASLSLPQSWANT